MTISDEIKCPSVKVLGRNRFCVSNYKEIIEYTDKIVRINTKDFVVSVCGRDFEIVYISDEEVCADGKIDKIDII